MDRKEKTRIIAVDFDGTLCFSKWPGLGEENVDLIHRLKNRQKKGDKLILWTCRTGDLLKDAIDWCSKKGIQFDAINENVPEIKELYGSTARKISADIYIDDKAISPMFFN